jgi:hypothetical protein
VLSGIAPAGGVGLLEVTGAPQVVINARLVSTSDGVELLGANLPILSSETLLPADFVAHVQAWERDDERTTDFALVNLGHSAATCDVDVISADGSQLVPGALVPLQPLSMIQFRDVLDLIGHPAISSVRARVSCDQDFYTFATNYNRETGEVTLVGPSETLASTLIRPGDEPPPPPPGEGCGEPQAGRHCFSRPGVFFTPTVAQDYRRERFAIPAGSYSSLHFRVEVFHNGWQQPPSGLHMLFWLAKAGRHFNLYGFAALKGPGANAILFRHGIGIPAAQKPKFEQNFPTQPGRTYVVDYVYNPVADNLVLKILDTSGNVLHQIVHAPNVNQIHIEPGEDLTADFSFVLGHNPNEPPTYGWQYKNWPARNRWNGRRKHRASVARPPRAASSEAPRRGQLAAGVSAAASPKQARGSR